MNSASRADRGSAASNSGLTESAIFAGSDITVLMAIWEQDDPHYFSLALKSVTIDQVLKPAGAVVVCDGPLSLALEEALQEFGRLLGARLRVIRLPDNVGLGAALNRGLDLIDTTFIARMDADDISCPERLQVQYAFATGGNYDVTSCNVEEWSPDMTKLISVRRVPLDDRGIKRSLKWRNPINHPGAFIRTSALRMAGGYVPLRKCQDLATWTALAAAGYRFGNLRTVLVKMRAGDELAKRRGFSYVRGELEAIRYQESIGFITREHAIAAAASRVLLRSLPRVFATRVRRWLRSA